jgi:hypothetical protein
MWTMVLLQQSMLNELRAAVPAKHRGGCKSSLVVRDRVGVLETRRWLPLDTFGVPELGH